MRSRDSRTVRWTVHVTRREFELLEILRCDWRGCELREDGPQSRAELLFSLVTWLMFDDPAAAGLRRVAQAWQEVQYEQAMAGDHTDRGGRKPRVRVSAAE
jgi:type II secretory pathway component PulM